MIYMNMGGGGLRVGVAYQICSYCIEETVGRSLILRELGVRQPPQELRLLTAMYELSCWESLYGISL